MFSSDQSKRGTGITEKVDIAIPMDLNNCIYVLASSENPELFVNGGHMGPPLHRQNAHLPGVNSAFVSVASLDFGVFGACLHGFASTSYVKRTS